jgi:hypothetical protein
MHSSTSRVANALSEGRNGTFVRQIRAKAGSSASCRNESIGARACLALLTVHKKDAGAKLRKRLRNCLANLAFTPYTSEHDTAFREIHVSPSAQPGSQRISVTTGLRLLA